MERWHISYKAKTENYSPEITWCITPYGTLTEILNHLISTEELIEIVDIRKISE